MKKQKSQSCLAAADKTLSCMEDRHFLQLKQQFTYFVSIIQRKAVWNKYASFFYKNPVYKKLEAGAP